MIVYALTTTDNPYNPIDQFDQWLTFDMEKNYNTCAYLDRIANTSSQLTDSENFEETKRAMQQIVRYDPLNLYKIVSKEIED